MPGVKLDESRFPVAVLHGSGATTYAELSEFFAAIQVFAERAMRARLFYAVVSDGDAGFTPKHRMLVADWLAKQPASLTDWELGYYVVVPSTAARSGLTALRWLVPSLSKLHVYPRLEDALAAAVATLGEHNGPHRRGSMASF
jgi:hypothetical protein